MKITGAIMTLFMAGSALADVYMHNPAGSNNRNRERNANRNNANRLFDSQNNGKGGYPWRGDRELANAADPMRYTEGSTLRVEWTAQHSCGPNTKTSCMLNIQYACQDTLPGVRDGYPSGALQDSGDNRQQRAFQRAGNDGTNQIQLNNAEDTEYGRHEVLDSPDGYNGCRYTERNKGLYTADQNLKGNSAKYTRQNPNGDRSGLECPEERDYYPYWRPTPWKDAAILTSDTAFCPYYQANSQNVKAVNYCDCNNASENNLNPLTEDACIAKNCAWKTAPAKGLAAPECKLHPFSRDNHLGNTVMEGGVPETAHYDWTLPTVPAGLNSIQCTLRVRYNITTADYDSTSSLTAVGGVFDSKYNCEGKDDPECGGDDLTQGQKPRYNRPYVQMFGGDVPRLGLAMNTNQLGRTFQDRSYVFEITKRPVDIPASAKIWNLNTRGKRGNIVQSYPAVEYDFVPNRLEVAENDYVHYQWTGSDFNTARNPNDGEGWRYSDRFNMAQVESPNTQIPYAVDQQYMFPDYNTAKAFALLNQQSLVNCKDYDAGDNGEQNNIDNCGKLNAAKAHQDFGIMPAPRTGVYHYVSTRNNNFSNRGQKGTIVVRSANGALPGIPSNGDDLPSYGDGGTGTTAPDFAFVNPPSFGSADDVATRANGADGADINPMLWGPIVGAAGLMVIVAAVIKSRRKIPDGLPAAAAPAATAPTTGTYNPHWVGPAPTYYN